jgi:hypothetical protein
VSAPASAPFDLAGDLWRAAQAAAGEYGFQFSAACSVEIQNFIGVGVTKLVADGETSNASKMAEARQAIGRLVAKMIELAIQHQRDETAEAQRRGEPAKVIDARSARMLHEYSFFSARSWFCPCYPFC